MSAQADPRTIPRASRRQARASRMRHVLDIAGRAFAERGFHEVSMDDIAKAAGVSKPVVYTHFESKDGLYEAVLRNAADDFAARVRAGVGAKQAPEERMWAGILAFLDAVEEHPEWWLLTRQASVSADEVAVGLARRAQDASSELIGALIAEDASHTGMATPAETTEPLARAFVGACSAIADWWIAHPEVPKGTVAMTLMNMMWMGFGDLLEANVWLPPDARET
jgi:AcrR family transcriptional regulator